MSGNWENATTMQPSEACIAWIEQQEGCALTAYPDVDGTYVLGYGCQVFDGHPVKPGQTTDAAGADRNCRAHAARCAVLVTADCPNLTQGQLDALVDFTYNLGIGAFLGSTLRRTIAARELVTEFMFTEWDKIHQGGALVVLPALTRRRLGEYQFWSKETP
jgi:lysozyme